MKAPAYAAAERYAAADPKTLDADSGTLLVQIAKSAPQTGAEWKATLGWQADRFDAAQETLWTGYFLQGRAVDGCCQDPCGADCICASRPDRIWLLTIRGAETAAQL